MNSIYLDPLKKTLAYIEESNFSGYDPYDTLDSYIPFKSFGKWAPIIAIQFQKRNPVNIRSLLGIKKGHNPKAIGLMLKSYSKLFEITKEKKHFEAAKQLFQWLDLNYSKGYSGKCWGYNFDWASKGSFLPSFTPSVVVTSFVIDGIYEYFKVSNDLNAKELINSSARYIIEDIPIIQLYEGISFSYTHLSKGCCYNASLLATEILGKSDLINGTSCYSDLINNAIRFVLSKQNKDGSWYYSFDPKTGKERKQVDFHQGFILVSLSNLRNVSNMKDEIDNSIQKGLDYYRSQFNDYGQAFWRMPEKWPVDIHNQSQGIITFSKLWRYKPAYKDFASVIAKWTIENMQSEKGFFYYRKNRLFTNRIPYMRWSQAWMVLALTELLTSND